MGKPRNDWDKVFPDDEFKDKRARIADFYMADDGEDWMKETSLINQLRHKAISGYTQGELFDRLNSKT